MTDLARRVRRAAQQTAVDDDGASDARRDRHVDEVPRSPGGASDSLSDGRHDRVAIEIDRSNPELLCQPRTEWVIDEPDHVRGLMHDAASMVERTRRGAGHRGDLAQRSIHGGERGAGALCDRGDDVLRARARRDALVAADDARHGIVVTRDDASDVRPAEIDAEIEAQTLGSLPATSGAFSAERSLLKTCCCAALYPFFALSFP